MVRTAEIKPILRTYCQTDLDEKFVLFDSEKYIENFWKPFVSRQKFFFFYLFLKF